MTQGNPYGRKGGRWPTATKLRALYNAGLTYDEIAQIVYNTEKGWDQPPSRSGVKRKLDALGFEPRNLSHADIMPWRGKIKPEHQSSELRHMLEAESRRRQGKAQSEADRSLIGRLHSLLFPPGMKPMVVSYHPEVGFFLVLREEYDRDIIREPRADRYADPGIEVPSPGAKPLPRPQREASSSHAVASSRTQACGTG